MLESKVSPPIGVAGEAGIDTESIYELALLEIGFKLNEKPLPALDTLDCENPESESSL